ncbi:hypothetical protein [Roseivirga sp.]|uniref:hypothetical protein n=1 Tax=Roseivirga sp. TaxID=1964215 RepID=UPI003B8DFA11
MKIKTLKYYLLFSFSFLTLGFSSGDLKAQDITERPIVQLSALVMNADSTQTIPYVHIFDQRGRGNNTDFRGWINHAFFAGDSLTISAVGFKNIRVKVPEDIGDQWTVIFALESEARQLQDVEINPFPSEELFKEAILAMNLTNDQENIMNNFAPEVIQELIRITPLTASPSANFRFMQNQQLINLQNSAGPRANPLLNPFAWGQFINSLKRKKKK